MPVTKRRTERPCEVGRTICLALVICASCLLPNTAFAQLRGRVVAVTDGDTVTMLTTDKQQQKLRFNGIDAPEVGQDFGQASKKHLAGLVFGKDVLVIGSKRDRYGRLVATVMLGEVNVNVEMLRAGLAWFYRQYASDIPAENRPAYEQAETEARAAKRGLWRDAHQIPPWDFRHPPPSQQSTGRPPVVGNQRSRIYHLQSCPDYGRVTEANRVPFDTPEDAEKAGFRKARNCP